MTNDEPVFTDPFYIKKFMQIQQHNVILYKKLLALQENATTKELAEFYFGSDFFDILKDGVS